MCWCFFKSIGIQTCGFVLCIKSKSYGASSQKLKRWLQSNALPLSYKCRESTQRESNTWPFEDCPNLEMRGIEPLTFCMQSRRAATVPHPPCLTNNGHLLIIIPKKGYIHTTIWMRVFTNQIMCCRMNTMTFKLDDTCVYCAVLMMPWTIPLLSNW